jgi:hypothetical protein
MNPNEEKHEQKSVTIIVNGRPKEWSEKKISFTQVVVLAFGTYENNDQIIYTMTYKANDHSNHGETMVLGDEVNVHPGMVFNVSRTDKS